MATGCMVWELPKRTPDWLFFAQDGAQVLKLSQAFGGVEYMSDRAREFIENWEVESYREKVAS